jgi:pimeloyl-ACP methyl ester carboxylesterase
MPFVEHDGIRFHYELRGEGPAVALCHGLTGDLEQPRDLIGPVTGFLQLFWDARGHGKTDPPGPMEGFAFDVFAQDLAALLDQLAIPQAVVGGISMGAAVSTRFAIRYPERVRALVLIRPAWLEQPSPEGLRLFPVVADYLARFGAEEGCRLLERLPEYQAIRECSPDTASVLRDQFFIEHAIERRGRLVGIPNDAPIRAWEETEHLRMPALVLGCEPDLVHPLSHAVTWAERLPMSRFVQVPAKSAGFEPYARAVRTHVLDFLKSLQEESNHRHRYSSHRNRRQ